MIPNGVVIQAGAFVRDVCAASVFIAKPQDPANSIVTKAAAIRWDERRIIFLEFLKALQRRSRTLNHLRVKTVKMHTKSSPNISAIASLICGSCIGIVFPYRVRARPLISSVRSEKT